MWSVPSASAETGSLPGCRLITAQAESSASPAGIVERQVAHIQKESMALLPLLDDLLDEDDDRELAFAYAEQ